jgi:hypothetical protein
VLKYKHYHVDHVDSLLDRVGLWVDSDVLGEGAASLIWTTKYVGEGMDSLHKKLDSHNHGVKRWERGLQPNIIYDMFCLQRMQ